LTACASEMRELTTVAVSAGVVSVALPARLLTVINLQDQYNIRIRPRDLKSLLDRRNYDLNGNIVQADAPMFYSMTGSTFEFDYAPTANITLELFGLLPGIAWRRDRRHRRNQFRSPTKYPHMLRAAILMFVADFLNDEAKYNRYMQRYSALEQQAMQSSDMEMLGMQVDMDYSESRL